VPSGHGFNRAETVSPGQRLQPLRANDAPQGLKLSFASLYRRDFSRALTRV